MKNKNLKLLQYFSFLLPFIFPVVAYAAAGDLIGTVTAPVGVPNGVSQVNAFISVIIRFFVVIAGLFTFWQFLSGGFDMITASGDKAKVQGATQKITSGITGLAIIAGSFIIIALAGQVLFTDPMAFINPKLNSL